MEEFVFYLKLGWEHIISPSALDHLLFITCLAVVFVPARLKQLIILLTAFTIGHSITLALNVWQVINVNEYLVEILIPVTIVITALINLIRPEMKTKFYYINYGIALLFGLVHGLGYANTLRFLLSSNQSIGWPLFGFNVGLELGQILVAGVVVLITLLFTRILRLPHTTWIRIVTSIAIITSIYMIIERI